MDIKKTPIIKRSEADQSEIAEKIQSVIETINNSIGISNGTFNNCTITIKKINNGTGIRDVSSVVLYFTHIKCSAITSLSNTEGKLNVLNNTVLHVS